MSSVSGENLSIAMQAIAHNICNTLHPETQINMTGWMSMNGQFLVSCAYCKGKVYDFYRKETDGKINNQQE